MLIQFWEKHQDAHLWCRNRLSSFAPVPAESRAESPPIRFLLKRRDKEGKVHKQSHPLDKSQNSASIVSTWHSPFGKVYFNYKDALHEIERLKEIKRNGLTKRAGDFLLSVTMIPIQPKRIGEIAEY